MANTRSSGLKKEYAMVDSAPEADGFFTNKISIPNLKNTQKAKNVFFSIRETDTDPSDGSVITVVLQFKCAGESVWTDYVFMDGTTLSVGVRVAIGDYANGVEWRAGVKSGGYTSGSLNFGFDW